MPSKSPSHTTAVTVTKPIKLGIMKSFAILSALAAFAASSPCPYGQLAESGSLSQEESAKFFAARSDGEAAIEAQMREVKRAEKIEHQRQEKYYKRQLGLGELSLGGGLLGGVLQPLSGVLEGLDIPT